MDTFADDIFQPLLGVSVPVEEKQYFNEALDEDSSSGYESTDIDVSDTESDWSVKSADSVTRTCKHVTQRGNCARSSDHVSARVKSTNTLCASLKLIIDMPELCDVTFLVGQEEVPVHGVRAILGTRSKVFYQLILKHMSLQNAPKMKHRNGQKMSLFGERLTIPVKKYGEKVFRMLVQFIHSGTATITDETVSGLLCGADQFELRDLQNACWEYIDTRIKHGHGQQILAATRKYAHHKMSQAIFDEIYAMLDKQRHVSSPRDSIV